MLKLYRGDFLFISPMLLHKVDEPFNDESYITELKLDGFRTIFTKFNDKVKIYTRHKTDITSMYPELHDIPVPNGTVLDGEIIVTDNQGKPDFEACMQRFKSKRSEHEISYSVFDILYSDNNNVTNLPLLERKDILASTIVEDTKLLNKVKYTVGNAIPYFELTKQHNLEGIVQKKANSRYQVDKRSSDWLKVINYQYNTVYIAGLRKGEFGLLLNFEDGSYAGLMEFMPTPQRKLFYNMYRDLITGESDKFTYIKPDIKINVKYRNLTSKGLLRIPSFVDWAN